MPILRWFIRFFVRAAEVAVALLVLGAFALWAVARMQTPPQGPVGEVVPPDEGVYTSQIIDSGLNLVQAGRKTAGDGVYRRDAHAKTVGCVLAKFSVKPSTDSRTEQGLFAKPAEYKAWIRFSSGSEEIRSDWTPDARGMAIKVLGVPGRKLLDGEEDSRSNDFLMINNPVFFIRNVREYALATQYQGDGDQFGYYFAGHNPLNWRLRELWIGLGILKWPPRNVLATQFHSMTAYKLGTGNYVKYTAKPVACQGGSVPSGWVGPGYNALRGNLEGQIHNGAKYCYDFMVQFQDRAKYMPVEDPTVLWKESDSPFVRVATLEIDGQDHEVENGLAANFCENLSYSPWRTLPAHEPVGGLNRVREAVYHNISRFRRCKNGVAFGEPLEDGSMKFDSVACQATEPVPAAAALKKVPQ